MRFNDPVHLMPTPNWAWMEAFAYFDRLTALFDSAEDIDLIPLAGADPDNSGENAKRYAALNPESEVVSGWSLLEIPDLSLLRILAHSAVRRSGGVLVDVTPPQDDLRGICRFLSHRGTPEEHEALVRAHKLACHPPLFATSQL